METHVLILVAMQLAFAAGFVAFFAQLDRRVRLLERRLQAAQRQASERTRGASPGAAAPHRPAPTAVEPAPPPDEFALALSAASATLASGRAPEGPREEMSHIVRLAREGCDAWQIARATGRGRREVELLLELRRLGQGGEPLAGGL